MKKLKPTTIIKLLVVLVLLISGAYAIFTDTLAITGTAGTTGEFDIIFFSATPANTEGCTPSATISPDGKTLTVAVDDLAYPTAGTDFTIVVKNDGNVSAILNSITITGGDDPDIVVSTTGLTESTVIEPTSTHSFTLNVEWASGSQAENKSIIFSADLVYEQHIL